MSLYCGGGVSSGGGGSSESKEGGRKEGLRMMCIGLDWAKGPSVCTAAGRVRPAVAMRESGLWGEDSSEVEERLEVVMEAVVVVLGVRSVLMELAWELAWL